MAVERSSAVVIGRFPMGESDRVVTFFTRRFGKVRGVARAARRVRSRFGGALEPFTLGELVFFDGGRSELVQVDHFDIVQPFARVREDLGRLGHAAWMTECVARLTAERDPNAAVFVLLVRALTAIEGGVRPARVAVAFGVRYVDVLGQALRTDACVACGAGMRVGDRVAFDPPGGGTVCAPCAHALGGTLTVSGATLATLRRLGRASWTEATSTPLGRSEIELRVLLEAQVASLIGQSTRSARFLREVSRASTPEARARAPEEPR
jgi:DNA repair protein RecO (recombination protein O)